MSRQVPASSGPGTLAGRAPEGPQHQAFLSLVLASQDLVQEVSDVVRERGLTESQFNVLRILRGAGERGLPCSKIGARMLTRVPDVTRLADRLERMGLAERHRDNEVDRRVVRVVISSRGRAVLQELDGPVRDLHRAQFGALTGAELEELNRLLIKLRERWKR